VHAQTHALSDLEKRHRIFDVQGQQGPSHKAVSMDRATASEGKMLRCPTCTTTSFVDSVVAHDRFFGIPGDFVYHACAVCGSLWLANIPELSLYYPTTYYSLAKRQPYLQSTLREIATAMLAIRAFLALGSVPNKSSRILDVGCGDGYFCAACDGSAIGISKG